jgi:hypothetical protein
MEQSVSRMMTVIDLARNIRERHNKPLKSPLREMVVVHPDVNFLDDITGQLGEVHSFSKLYAILSYLCSVVTELMLLTFLAPLLSFLSSVFTEMHSFWPPIQHTCMCANDWW